MAFLLKERKEPDPRFYDNKKVEKESTEVLNRLLDVRVCNLQNAMDALRHCRTMSVSSRLNVFACADEKSAVEECRLRRIYYTKQLKDRIELSNQQPSNVGEDEAFKHLYEEVSAEEMEALRRLPVNDEIVVVRGAMYHDAQKRKARADYRNPIF